MIKFIHTKNLSIFNQLEIEEALLKTDDDSWCLINEGSPRYIVTGISNKAEDLLHLDKLKEEKIGIVKRFSGGGTVIVDENTLFVTFIFSKKILEFSFPEEITRWTEIFFKCIFNSSDFSCKENDYLLKDKKCCGNAQYIKKDRWLHHSSFLWDYKIENMDFLKLPKKAPVYRRKRNHQEFLCSIKPLFSSKNEFVQKIKNNLNKSFNLIETSLQEIDKNLNKKFNKSTQLLEI